MEIVENFLQLVDIDEIVTTEEYVNMVDITVEIDNSFLLSNGIVSHNSAMGSILQKRNPKDDGVYALKGKIKNCKTIGDLSENKEILELMHILGLDPTIKTGTLTGYKRAVIATDADPDGAHITSLIINLFHKWFPQVVRSGQLMILRTPLVSTRAVS